MILDNKTILVTGGSGSFGTKFTQIALKNYNPKVIRVFSNNEHEQYLMRQAIRDERVRYLIGDVRDKDRLCRAMKGVEIVVHAAALKEVPACEYNPFEAVKTNSIGTQNVIEAAIDCNVEKAINISTDKAVNPVNLYGATKMCAEKLFVQANSYSGADGTKFACSRYGNVAGSRGSVIPLFLKQKNQGIITVTDEKMTRFWISLEDGIRFVADCIEKMHGGEIFIPKIPSMKIIDLARIIAPQALIKITGIRPGEKLDEALLTAEEVGHAKEFENYYVIEPEFPFWDRNGLSSGKNLPKGFTYTSGNCNDRLSRDQIEKILQTLEIEK